MNNINNIKKMYLPDWLDYKLFQELGAVYYPTPSKVKYTLSYSSEDLRDYLGTYFPRSFVESFCIFDELFQNQDYVKTLSNLKVIDILDFGCGTGGQLIGLAMVLQKYLPSVKILNVFAIDGNQDALNILSFFCKELKQKVNLRLFEHIILSEGDLSLKFINHKFHFILNSKVVNELINKQNLSNAYFLVANALTKFLAKEGIFYILDLTMRPDTSNYFFPMLMNEQLNKFILENQDFSTLVPLACAKWYNCKEKQCFSQRVFKIYHSGLGEKKEDISKVAYRIICRTELRNLINKKIDFDIYNSSIHRISPQNVCPHSLYNLTNNQNYINSFEFIFKEEQTNERKTNQENKYQINEEQINEELNKEKVNKDNLNNENSNNSPQNGENLWQKILKSSLTKTRATGEKIKSLFKMKKAKK